MEDTRKLSRQKELDERLRRLIPPNGCLYYGKPRHSDGTGRKVLKAVRDWFNDGGQMRMAWIYGRAGCGKTLLTATVCAYLDIDGTLLGNFFCSQDEEERSDPTRLIQTLAFYLAEYTAPYKAALHEALQKLDVNVNNGLDAQFHRLIERPLGESRRQALSEDARRGIFVVDGLDECDERETVIKLLLRVVQLAPWLSILVVSRDIPVFRKELSGRRIMKLELTEDLLKDDEGEVLTDTKVANSNDPTSAAVPAQLLAEPAGATPLETDRSGATIVPAAMSGSTSTLGKDASMQNPPGVLEKLKDSLKPAWGDLDFVDDRIKSRIQHLDLNGSVLHKEERAKGGGAYSDVFKGAVYVKGRGSVHAAFKRMRFYVNFERYKKVRSLSPYLCPTSKIVFRYMRCSYSNKRSSFGPR